jgi:hypothetical protein
LRSWEREPQGRTTHAGVAPGPFTGIGEADGAGGQVTAVALRGEPNSRRGCRGNLFSRLGHDEEDRAAVPNGEAGALEASKALLGGQKKPL